MSKEAEMTLINDGEFSPIILNYLKEQLGEKIVAYIGGFDKVEKLKKINKFTQLQGQRLSCLYRITELFLKQYDATTLKAWLFGTNHFLGDEAPAWEIRYVKTNTKETFKEVLAAAKQFLQ